MKTVLTIAGSDCSGGAGIEADLKTITAHKMYAMTAITALTAQNTTAVYGILETPPAFLAQQLNCVFSAIQPDAVKIGMVSNAQSIAVIAQCLVQYGAKNIVIDPVMIATSGRRLLKAEAMDALLNQLLPLATVVTPNLPEAQALCGFAVKEEGDMQKSAEEMAKRLHCAVLLKGGHLLENSAADLLYEQGTVHWYRTQRVQGCNTHGTGCTLSSALACELAAGNPLAQSVQNAKAYVTGALKAGLASGHLGGALEHTYAISL